MHSLHPLTRILLCLLLWVQFWALFEVSEIFLSCTRLSSPPLCVCSAFFFYFLASLPAPLIVFF
eukprot:m.959382 g.959382  ORF g.959382 m.959382 type:complete len:64 (-) comp401243_c0_seq1:63-254(-)